MRPCFQTKSLQVSKEIVRTKEQTPKVHVLCKFDNRLIPD